VTGAQGRSSTRYSSFPRPESEQRGSLLVPHADMVSTHGTTYGHAAHCTRYFSGSSPHVLLNPYPPHERNQRAQSTWTQHVNCTVCTICFGKRSRSPGMSVDPASPRTSSSITFHKWCNITPTRPTTACQVDCFTPLSVRSADRVHSDNALMISSRSSSFFSVL
jgi:hypothetical protein